jgi:hypothetical protein
MATSVLAIFDAIEAPLLDYLAARSSERASAASPPRRERPALDSCRLLAIFSPFRHPRAGDKR